jgi:hypothetical protein
VDDQLTRPRRVRIMLAIGWTCLVVLAVLGVDRVFLGVRPEPDWVQVERIEDLPAAAGAPQMPSFLPEAFGWPPATVLHRSGKTRGWWLGLRLATGGETALWIGSGVEPAPLELGELARVVGAPGLPPPEGWHQLSRQFVGGETVHVIGRLDAETLLNVLDGLHPIGR